MDAVDSAFAATPRSPFLPREERRRAGYDGPLPIGCGMTCSQPRTVAAMLRLLDVRPGQRVLDVGSGSGWTTALLAHLTGPTGEVLGLELEPDLVAVGAANLAAAARPAARIEAARPGTLGDPAGAPYDRVLVSAEADALPDALVAQLAPGGRMVIPVRGTMLLVRAEPDGPEITHHGAYLFVPLREP
ncbi:protein-L-isoaspartate O-methyltransferase family protein [Nocardioides ochotonae]|uniref:protein-L-isoaspartate O-methyltransferase family protein n=1 Tax=Nocardioides ochotonae TaxID=2685869 RepID=UPI001409CED8|nr:methyltransferase domain-containing protein [Nocardioides ochotonae]